jgi:probable HAF family extracellular repeat protein
MTSQIKIIMNTRHHLNHLKLALIVGALALPLTTHAGQHPRYKLVDLGTFGGPSSSFTQLAKIINSQGAVVGGADTAIPDPFAPNCFTPSCFVQHAFKWQNGVLSDLGTLPGGTSSFALWINKGGQTVGVSQNGLIDPLTGASAQIAVLWKSTGEIINLGTLGGNQSLAVALNDRSQAVGAAANAIPDSFSLSPVIGGPAFGTQTRAFLWENGVMRDLGTLGGPDSFAGYVNEGGQVAGISYTDSTPNDTTGIPTVHPFLWENGRMLDLGSLGGTFASVNDLNNRGQVVGPMYLPGDEFQHPYLWSHGTLTDLGTFGGSNGNANGVNEAGEVVGVADFPGDVLHNAFLWNNGVMTDLGNLGKTSNAHSINSKGQVVGASKVSFETGELRAFLWEKGGGPMVDLNNLVPANSAFDLVSADHISDRGEIVVEGVPAGVPFGDIETRGHVFLLIPVGEE